MLAARGSQRPQKLSAKARFFAVRVKSGCKKDRLRLKAQAVSLSFGFQDTANTAYCTVVTVFTISST